MAMFIAVINTYSVFLFRYPLRSHVQIIPCSIYLAIFLPDLRISFSYLTKCNKINYKDRKDSPSFDYPFYLVVIYFIFLLDLMKSC